MSSHPTGTFNINHLHRKKKYYEEEKHSKTDKIMSVPKSFIHRKIYFSLMMNDERYDAFD